MAADETPIYNDGNWTLMYVLLALIPLVFGFVVLYSLRRDSITQAQNRENDIEMAVLTSEPAHHRWESMSESESQGGRVSPCIGAKVPRQPAATRAPANCGKPSGRLGRGGINRSPPGFEEIPL